MPMETEVQTEVVAEKGQWAVYLLILTPDGIERRHLKTCFTLATAEFTADVVRRTAARRRSPGTEQSGETDELT
jgi:hypothetical protein